ncbi:MAG: hypothetical protein CMI18_11840 [Opitutaceae bacterium]|mgnify:CR=1 FL=1|nr:hypothetical protein [Opitutaceae bacterium]|tara:strand:- start:8014 stop:9111 length:1098 start_codon:yes stop_codon:yes gene_type:complete
MKAKVASLAILLSAFGFSSLQAQPEGDFSAVQRRISSIFEENSAAVFRVIAAHATYDENGELQNKQIHGTGCFISREGHILASASVAQNSDRTWFIYDGVSYICELIGVEPTTNMALLKANNLPLDFNFFFPEANQALPDIGSLAVMISCPLEFDPSPALTMVAGTETRFAKREFATTLLRINSVTRGGESGAPLVGLNGRFLGIQVATTSKEIGFSYVLPARAVLRVRDDLLFAGKFIHGWIGIDIRARSTIRDGRQIYLTSLLPGSPAEVAGLFPNDILVRMGDFNIKTFSDVSNAMFFARVGQFLDVQVFRDGVLHDFTVKVIERPKDPPLRPVPAEVTNPTEDSNAVPERRNRKSLLEESS